jgi:hypothetical protein
MDSINFNFGCVPTNVNLEDAELDEILNRDDDLDEPLFPTWFWTIAEDAEAVPAMAEWYSVFKFVFLNIAAVVFVNGC